MPFTIHEFDQGVDEHFEGFAVNYVGTINFGINGREHYFKLTVSVADLNLLNEKATKFASMFMYKSRGPGSLFCDRYNTYKSNEVDTGAVVCIYEDYDV